jgi:hypothetical protein
MKVTLFVSAALFATISATNLNRIHRHVHFPKQASYFAEGLNLDETDDMEYGQRMM